MKKKYKVAGIVIAGSISSFILGMKLEINHMERMITSNALHYYEAGTHVKEEKYKMKDDAFEDGILDEEDLIGNINVAGYEITSITSDADSVYADVTYINNEDVIDIIDDTDFGAPICEFNPDYVRAAKRLYLKR